MGAILEALLLGIVQGLTEFLPVSSSGHLEIIKHLLDDQSVAEQSMMTTVVLHFATALATIVIFRNDIIKILKGLFSGDGQSRNFAVYVIISMIPAVVIGLLFEDILETFFHRKIVLVSFMLILTGFLLLISERTKSTTKPIGFVSALIIGISQAIAMIPGISRSGATISTSLLLGVERTEAARFSFLMVIPLIFGKIAKDVLSGDLVQHMESPIYLSVGFLAAFFTGLFACTAMLKIVKNAKLSYFAFYCFIVGITIIGYSFITS